MNRKLFRCVLSAVLILLLIQTGFCRRSETHARGVIQSRHEYRFSLQPGQSVKRCLHRDNGPVEAGTLILELNGDSLRSRLLDMQRNVLELGSPAEAEHVAEIALQNAKAKFLQAKMNVMLFEQSFNNAQTNSMSSLQQLKLRLLKDMLKASELAMRVEQSRFSRFKERYRLNLDSMLQQMKYLRRQEAQLKVKAPFSGTIQFLNQPQINNHKSIIPVFVLQDMNDLIVEVRLIQSQFVRISAGARARIVPDFIEGIDMTGSVVDLQGIPEKDENGFLLFPVTIQIDSPRPKRVLPGMTVLVTLYCNESP